MATLLCLVLCLSANSYGEDSTPQHTTLFEDIARYTEYVRHGAAPEGDAQGNGEPSSKKRKVEHEPTTNGLASKYADEEKIVVIFKVKDLSFQLPLRKKLDLEIARVNEVVYTIHARNAGTNTIERGGLSSSFGTALLAGRAEYC